MKLYWVDIYKQTAYPSYIPAATIKGCVLIQATSPKNALSKAGKWYTTKDIQDIEYFGMFDRYED